MTRIIVLFLLLTSCTSPAGLKEKDKAIGTIISQTVGEVNNLLLKDDLEGLKNYAVNVCEFNFSDDCSREIASGYMEGIIHINKCISDPKNSGVITSYPFRIRYISKDKKLIYYVFGEEKNHKVNGKWQAYYSTISHYRNNNKFTVLKQAFRQIYLADLNEKELFIDNIIYGDRCGYDGSSPKEKIQIDEFIKNKDRKSLMKWLQSTNTEKQVYAVDGFYQLKKAGTAPNATEFKMIKNVLNKRGNINMCSGCSFGAEDISDITKGFRF